MIIIADGLSLGAIYALIALGYTMVYGIAKMLNFAHGDIIMVGAYVILTTLQMTGNPYIAIAASVVVCTVAGIVIERLAYKPLRGASPLAVLITAIGVSFLLQAVAQLIYGSKSQAISLPDFGKITIAGNHISVSTLITLIVGGIIMAGLTVFVKKTSTGRAMQAVSEDRGAALLMGVNVNRIIMITFAIGSALAAFASLFYLMQIPSITPTLGSMPGIKAFTAAVIGGIGSIPGAALGGVLLGIIEIFAKAYISTELSDAIVFLVLILVLLIRPAGLLGKKTVVKV